MIAELNNWHTMSWLWLLANTAAKEPDDSQIKQILDFLNNNPMIGWGIAGFAVMAMATAAIAKWTGNLEKIIVFGQKYLSRKKPEITEAQRQQAREDLIEILLKQVVKRLEDSLHHKIRIDLRREEQRQRVGQHNLPPVQDKEISEHFIKRAFKRLKGSTPTDPVSDRKSTQELFNQEDIQGRLLILGEPGSGKTNELLVLARDLLSRARKSPDTPIPVIFELSEWNAELEFADWLGQQLYEKYNIPLVISKHWIEHHRLLPLLDGLDELRRVDEANEITVQELDKLQIAKQIQCVRDINIFLDTSSLPLVVCCRRKEYEAIEAQGEYLKRLKGAIYLQALEEEQIREYLQKSNRQSLWEAIKNQPELLRLAQSPLFLLILIVAYHGQNICNTEELLNEYIHKQLNDLNNQGAYPPGKAPTPEETNYYLSWLAIKLELEEITEFVIERLQPSWLYTSQIHVQYRWILMLLFGMSGGPIDIKISEKLNFSWKDFCRVGFMSGLSSGIFIWLSYRKLIVGVIFGLIGGLIGGLSSSIQTYEVDVRDKRYPNQGIRDSLRIGLIIGLIGVISGAFCGTLIGGLSGGLVIGLCGGLIGGLIFGLYFGLDTVLYHISLRFVLYQSGVAPWNYARFLEHAENHRFIQRTGGHYRFVHDLLRKRFAATLKQP